MNERPCAYTYIEVVVVTLLLGLVASSFYSAMDWNRSAMENMARLDFLEKNRNAMMTLGGLISHGTKLIFPARVSEEWSSYAIFQSDQGNLCLLSRNENDQMTLFSQHLGPVTPIIDNTVWLKTRLVRGNLLEIRFKSKINHFEITVGDRFTLDNTVP